MSIISAKDLRMAMNLNCNNWRKIHGKPMKRRRYTNWGKVRRNFRKLRRRLEKEQKRHPITPLYAARGGFPSRILFVENEVGEWL